MTDDLFRNRLDQMIDLRHPLEVLANRKPWQEIDCITGRNHRPKPNAKLRSALGAGLK